MCGFGEDPVRAMNLWYEIAGFKWNKHCKHDIVSVDNLSWASVKVTHEEHWAVNNMCPGWTLNNAYLFLSKWDLNLYISIV